MIRFFFTALLLFGMLGANAQNYQKEAKKQRKVLEKEGWQVLPGDQPLEEQLANSLELRNRISADIIVSEGSATSPMFESAMKGSKMMAQRSLASLFASKVKTLVESTQGSELERFLSKSVVKVSASLRSNTVMTIYREKEGNYEFKTVVSCATREFWNLLPENDKQILKDDFGISDDALENTGG